MMEPTATVSQKGQVVIPSEVRQALGIKEGDRMSFRINRETGAVEMKRIPTRAERRRVWLEQALGTYEAEHVWSGIDGEDFADEG